MKTFRFLFTVVTVIAAINFLSGCGDSEEKSPTSSTDKKITSQTKESGHSHGEGPHGGALADWGGGKYHVEFTVDHDKKESVVYILGSDEKSPSPIEAVKVLLSIEGPNFQVELVADPLDGEAKGTSSRFVGTHDNLGIVQEFEGTISAEVEGTPYVGNFKEVPHED